MSKAKALGVIFLLLVLGIGGFMLLEQSNLGEEIQVDMTLKLQSTDGSHRYWGAYHWGAKKLEGAQTVGKVQWNDRSCLATIQTSGELTEVLRVYLSEIEIETDRFSARTDGSWKLFLRKKLCQGVYIDMTTEGNNVTIDHITPSLSVDLLPSALSNELKTMGVDTLDIIVTLSLSEYQDR